MPLNIFTSKKYKRKNKRKIRLFSTTLLVCFRHHHNSLQNKETNRAKNAADIKQLQEDLTQEREENKQNPEEKKKALTEIIENYNKQFNTNHIINEFDLYYQDDFGQKEESNTN